MPSFLKGEVIQTLKIFRVTADEDKMTFSLRPSCEHPGDYVFEIRLLWLWDPVDYYFKKQLHCPTQEQHIGAPLDNPPCWIFLLTLPARDVSNINSQ